MSNNKNNKNNNKKKIFFNNKNNIHHFIRFIARVFGSRGAQHKMVIISYAGRFFCISNAFFQPSLSVA